jgi:mannose-6-phosphate isomerase-like protein (cupin superfamily)
MNIDGAEVVLPAGSVVRFPANVMHDVRNLQDHRLVIMFTKSPAKLERKVPKAADQPA